jgi:hypothetical protein
MWVFLVKTNSTVVVSVYTISENAKAGDPILANAA